MLADAHSLTYIETVPGLDTVRLTGFLSGWLAYFSVKLPELLAVGFMLVACLVAVQIKQFKSAAE